MVSRLSAAPVSRQRTRNVRRASVVSCGLALLAAGVAVFTPCRASAQGKSPFQAPPPNVLLLVDTSGSMERMPDGSLPVCTPGVAGGARTAGPRSCRGSRARCSPSSAAEPFTATARLPARTTCRARRSSTPTGRRRCTARSRPEPSTTTATASRTTARSRAAPPTATCAACSRTESSRGSRGSARARSAETTWPPTRGRRGATPSRTGTRANSTRRRPLAGASASSSRATTARSTWPPGSPVSA